MKNIPQALELIASSVETGYSSNFSLTEKEILSRKERKELASLIRNRSNQEQDRENSIILTTQSISDFERATRMGKKPQSSSAYRIQ